MKKLVQTFFFPLKNGEMSTYFWWRGTGYKSSQDILSGVWSESQGDTFTDPEDIRREAMAEQNLYPPLPRGELAHLSPKHFGIFQWILC